MLEMNLYQYLSFVVLPLLFLILKHFKSATNLPPGPFPWPIIGNILSMGKKPHVSLAQLAETHGPLMSLRLGTQILIVASSPAAATEILKTHDRILSGRTIPHAVPALPDRLHLSLGWADCTRQWKFLRTLCRTDLFSAKAIQSQANIRDDKVNELVMFLATKEGQSVKIAEVVFNTNFNTLSNLFLSEDLMSLQDGDQLKSFVRKFVDLIFTPNLADYYSILSRLDLQGLNKKCKEMTEKIYAVWEVIIRERRQEDKDGVVTRKSDFLDSLIHAGLTDDQINYLFTELFFAGTDTSTSTVEWAMAELIKNPQVMTKVCSELENEIKETVIIKDSDLPHLRYLHAVVNETLRLHPPAPFLLPRRAIETWKLMNYTIPKNAQVFVNVWAMGRDSKTWEDPMSFRPERFLESGIDINSGDFRFIPFGAGRRMCPGLPLAAKQIPLLVANLVNCFDWSLPGGMEPAHLCMDERFGITLQMEKPLVLIPRKKK